MIDAISSFIAFVDGLHPVLQFLAVFVIGIIPFLESYVGASVGIFMGMPWPIALGGGVAGNAVAVVAAVALAGRMRGDQSRVQHSPRRERIMARVDKWGVPVASLLAPTVLAISLTVLIMVVAGLNRRNVLVWNIIASVVWGAGTMALVIAMLAAVN